MAQAIGEKEGKSMKTKIKYTEEPMGNLRVVKDFLPPPDQVGAEGRQCESYIIFKEIQHHLFQKRSKDAEDFISENDKRSSRLVRFTLSEERVTKSIQSIAALLLLFSLYNEKSEALICNLEK